MKHSLSYCILIGLILNSCSPFPVNDYVDDLGSGYSFVSESNANQFIAGPDSVLIGCTVESYAFDSLHIIASQKPNKGCAQANLAEVYRKYWIVSKKDGQSFGPLDSLDFVNKQEELSIKLSMTSDY